MLTSANQACFGSGSCFASLATTFSQNMTKSSGVSAAARLSICLRPVYKPHSVQRIAPPGQSSLWAARRRAARCSLPGAVGKRAASHPSEDGFAPAWPCSRRGLPGRAHYCARRWSLTPPFHHDFPHPHPLSQWERGAGGGRAVCFCGPGPTGSRLAALPRPGCSPAPCSVECGLSSTPPRRGRDCPTGLRRFHHTRPGRGRQPGLLKVIFCLRSTQNFTDWLDLTETSRDWGKSRCEKRQNDIKIGRYSPILEESS